MEGDLTPMIDMTFQLIAFFMLIINFSNVEKSEDIELPNSTLAKPPEKPPEFQITLNLDNVGDIKMMQIALPREKADAPDSLWSGLKPLLRAEISLAEREGVAAGDITVIIRADKDTPTGQVRELMALCQEVNLETFVLRVREKT